MSAWPMTATYFPALFDLLEHGTTSRLRADSNRPSAAPTRRSATSPGRCSIRPDKGSPRSILGGSKPPRRHGRTSTPRGSRAAPSTCATRATRSSSATTWATDLRRRGPDRPPRRARGAHPAQPSRPLRGRAGTATVVLIEPSAEQVRRCDQRGAVVIGLGEYGKLTVEPLTEAVRVGVLRYLLQFVDRQSGAAPPTRARRGRSGDPSARLQFDHQHLRRRFCAGRLAWRVAGEPRVRRGDGMRDTHRRRLEFVEIYLDAAISAAYAIRALPNGGARSRATRLRASSAAPPTGRRARRAARLDAMRRRQRLLAAPDRHRCGARRRVACRVLPAAPAAAHRRDLSARVPGREYDGERAGGAAADASAAPARAGKRLRYVALSQRARAETTELQRQPGLVETLVECSVRDSTYKPDLSRTLFQLLVPHDFKETFRQAGNLVLVLDGYTAANFPWEMLVADQEPLIKSTAIVRQLASSRYRQQVRATLDKTAYVVGNPSTAGYYKAFPDRRRPDADGLDPLLARRMRHGPLGACSKRIRGRDGAARLAGHRRHQQAVPAQLPHHSHFGARRLPGRRRGPVAQRRRPLRRVDDHRRRDCPDGSGPRPRLPELLLQRQDGQHAGDCLQPPRLQRRARVDRDRRACGDRFGLGGARRRRSLLRRDLLRQPARQGPDLRPRRARGEHSGRSTTTASRAAIPGGRFRPTAIPGF